MRDHEIRWITKDMDFSALTPLRWDLVIGNKAYNVYHIEGYYHTVGSRYDDYWCCPADEEPSYENLRGYCSDECVRWGIHVDTTHYNNWKHECVENYVTAQIMRNGEVFYEFSTHDMNYSIAKAQTLLMQIKEHPLSFYERHFDKNLIGRKIWYREQPAIIRSYIHGQCCIMVEPDGVEKFKTPVYFEHEDWWDPYDKEVKLDCLESTDIWWFRD